MKLLKRIILIVFLLLIVGAISAWLYIKSFEPSYQGEVELSALTSEVSVIFDDIGVPHVKGSNQADIMTAVGYLHAKERIFQMELMRRFGAGELAEIFGEDALPVDVTMKTIGIDALSKENAKYFIENADKDIINEVTAYLKGVNAFIEKGEKPLDMTLAGVEMTPFDIQDLYEIAGYMAYSFGLAQRTEPIAQNMLSQHGIDFLMELGLYRNEIEPYIPTFPETDSIEVFNNGISSMDLQTYLPIPMFNGSNSWVVGGKKSKSGLPILCNDTHIAYSLPQVWYEMHIEYENGTNFYGNFLPGIPYALVGHNQFCAWGVTMLEHDDMDFYYENVDYETGTYLYDDKEFPLKKRSTEIKIKDQDDYVLEVYETHKGPLIQDALAEFNDQAVSMWWDYSKFQNQLIQAFREMNFSSSMKSFEEAIEKIHSPGLNITYADTDGNIAWWACAKMLDRSQMLHSKQILDGNKKSNEPIGYHPFHENPHSINPPSNYVYSANDQPGKTNGYFYPGYYKPHQRANRIKTLLEESDEFTSESMKTVMTDVTSEVDANLMHQLSEDLLKLADNNEENRFSKNELNFLKSLKNWDGSHELNDSAPPLFYHILYRITEIALSDELGNDFEPFISTHWYKRAYPLFINNPDCSFWDDSRTDEKETRIEILEQALIHANSDFEQKFGMDYMPLKWGDFHTLELPHPLGRVEALRSFVNLGPVSVRGGHETINQAGFVLNEDMEYKVRIGSQMRIIIDMSDPLNSFSIAPSGQSGSIGSAHYSDQFEKYCLGEFREQKMQNIETNSNRSLILSPK